MTSIAITTYKEGQIKLKYTDSISIPCSVNSKDDEERMRVDLTNLHLSQLCKIRTPKIRYLVKIRDD